MSRPRTPIGTAGAVGFERAHNGAVIARTRYRDDDGKLRQVSATGATERAAERSLKEKLTRRVGRAVGDGEVTADSPFTRLVDLWLEDIELEDKLAVSTRDLYRRNMRAMVVPAFEHYTLREMSVSRVDRFLKAQANVSYSRTKQCKVVLSLALGLAVRYEAIPRNPVLSASRLRRPPSKTVALMVDEVHAIRRAVSTWRQGAGYCGPKPDGQLRLIIETMLGTSARIGEVLAIRKCDVDVTAKPATARIRGTIVSPRGKPTYRQDKTKTDSSRRTIAVPSYAAEALRQRLVAAAGKDDEHLLFFTRNGTPLTTNNVRRQLRAIMDEAGIGRVTPQAFRRTVATVIDRADGAELAAELLGHSSSDITKAHYIEKDEHVDVRTAEILESLAPREPEGDQ